MGAKNLNVPDSVVFFKIPERPDLDKYAGKRGSLIASRNDSWLIQYPAEGNSAPPPSVYVPQEAVISWEDVMSPPDLGTFAVSTLGVKLEQADARGEIYSLLLPTGEELMLFHCKAGYLRGGHSHNVPEVVMVLSGQLTYYKKKGLEVVMMAGGLPGKVIWNLPGVPHMAEFLEDSWVIEYKIGTPAGTAVTTSYPPFRDQVDARMAELQERKEG